MRTSDAVVSLRIPELGPYLGKLVAGAAADAVLPLDAVRMRLATRIMEGAGEARRLAQGDDVEGAVAAMGVAYWTAAWHEAADDVTAMLLTLVHTRLHDEAAAVRMPARRLQPYLPSETERLTLGATLRSAGIGLTVAMDELAAAGDAVVAAPTADSAEHWQRLLVTAARKLEAAWIELEARAVATLERWEPVADRVAAWRRSWWPVVAVGAPLLAAATWLGLVFGGYVAPPAWLTRLWSAVVGG